MTHEPDTGRAYYERWLAENPEPADSNGCRGILNALLMVVIIAALITFVMWVWVA